jgi:cellulose synthase/poly-beta-1,6-N-acetylglucosamine synthase-like glycosyltransferase
VPTLAALTRQEYRAFSVLILDQSGDDATETAVLPFVKADQRFAYRRSATRGLSRARNAVVAVADGDILAFTDDDCMPAPDWLSTLVRYFRAYPDAGQVSGAVDAAPIHKAEGFVPTCVLSEVRHITSTRQFGHERSMGANTAYRLKVVHHTGGFDPLLGAGTPFPYCEDRDMTFRVLKRGYSVLDVPDARVTHFGVRPWTALARERRAIGLALGAWHAKWVRLGDSALLPSHIDILLRMPYWKRLLGRPRPSLLPLPRDFWHGVASSLRFELDRTAQVYVST